MYRKRALAVGLTLCIFLLFPLFVRRSDVLDLFLLLFLYTTLAQSWNILGGFAGQISLGHAAFFGMGSIVTRLLMEKAVSFPLAFWAGGVAAVVLAAIIGLPALSLRGIYFAIGTLGLALIMRISVANILPWVSFTPVKQLAAYSLISRYYVALSLAILTIGVVYLIVHSKMGLAMLTVRENEDAASASGVNVFKYKVIALGISSFFAGLAGSVFSYYYTSFYYYIPFDLNWCFDPLLITFIGGIGTIMGPIIGVVLFVILKEIFALSMGDVHALIFGIIFILVVLILPGGLIDAARKFKDLLSRLMKRESVAKGGRVLP
jgi:branched-chain amino acid transport system permease protein